MAEEQSGKSGLSQIVISCLLTALLSIVVLIFGFYYTRASPRLRYTIFPAFLYRNSSVNLAIYNAQIENSGTKEAEDVQVSFDFPKDTRPSNYKLELSSKAISHKVENPGKSNDLKDAIFHFPLLNPEESVKFSFLAENIPTSVENQNIKVALRAKGVVGEKREIIADKEGTLSFLLRISLLVLSVVTAFLAWTTYTSTLANYTATRRLSEQTAELNREIQRRLED